MSADEEISCQMLISCSPSPQAKTILLEQSEKQFMKSDESAFSIVPSRLSSRITLSTGRTGGHDSNSSYESIEYRRLSFEDDLFTARVYKRNYRSSRFQQLWKKESNRDREIVAPKEKRQDKNVGDDPMTLATPKSLTTVPVSWKDVQNPKLSDVTVSTTRSGSPEKIKQGLEYRDSSPVRRLAGACGRGDIDTVKSLLEITDVPEKLINEHCHQQFVCPIHATVLNGHVEVMETILQYVVGWALGYMMFCPRGPPIHLAAINEDLAMVQLLLGKTTSVSVRTNSGIQAVHLAAKTGSMEVLAALIDAGADVNCADRDGRQPLHYISESQDRPDVIKYLIKRGASPSGLHPLSVPTPLYLARENNFTGNVEILRTLKDDYLLALDTAIRDGSPSSVGTLIRKGGDPNRCRSDGGTGLHTFVLGLYTNVPRDKSTNRRILRLLLDHVDLLAETDYGNGFTVLDSLFHLGGKTDEVATLKLARLFRDNLPEHKSREDHILRCMMREKKP